MPREYDGVEEYEEVTPSEIIRSLNPDQYATMSPQEAGVGHGDWRPNQLSALQLVSDNMFTAARQVQFLELPTGSGKSAIPTALGANYPVLVYVESHRLLDQYEAEYGFKIVKGMAAYDCVLPEKISTYKERFDRTPKVSECHFKEMADCPVYDRCPYIIAREAALASKRMACTYAFGILSMKVRQRQGITVWDEAHLAAGIVVSLSENTFTGNFFTNFELSPPPIPFRAGLMHPNEKIKIIDWLRKCQKSLEVPPKNLLYEETNEWVAAYERISRMLSYFKKTEELYFNYDAKGHSYKVRMGSRTLERTTSRLLIKPLTAALNVPKLVGARSYTVLMSATMGDPAPLAKELGFKDYDFASYPHPIPAQYRPVFDLGFERMTWANLSTRPILYKLQAFKIAEWIKTLPEKWRGIILTSSYDKAAKLRAGLQSSQVGDRLFQFGEGLGVTERINQFYENNDEGKIAVDISYGWGHGISFNWDKARFVAVGSVPFGEFQDPFQKVRRENVEGAEEFAWWTAYTSVPQICGRVSRGEVLPDGTPLLNVAALADGSATSSYAMKYYPKWFNESIVRAK